MNFQLKIWTNRKGKDMNFRDFFFTCKSENIVCIISKLFFVITVIPDITVDTKNSQKNHGRWIS